VVAAIPLARAHEVRPAVLALKEISPGRFALHWSPPSDGTPAFNDTQPRFPEHCRHENETLIDCGERGLAGAIRFEGGAAFSGVSVDIEWLRGPRELRIASGNPAVLFVSGTPARASLAQRAEMALRYAAMGVKHILSGADHLMFVAGLLLFVRSLRRLLLTITSFTLAHSLTLAASTLHLVHAPAAPVELCIALSILLLGVEATRRRPTWTHRAPWVVAFVFGLLHGFGFASALVEVGLPPLHLPLALASFNIGVEAGQLMAVAVLVAGYRLLLLAPHARMRAEPNTDEAPHARQRAEPNTDDAPHAATRTHAHIAAVFVLGVASVYWCLERAVGMWRSLR
jgi:hydrogenase/urease accessory protein HupE